MVSCGLRRSEEGFTIVEALVASAILLVVALAITQVFAFASLSTQSNSVREDATELANQRIEQARNLEYDALGTVGGDPEGTIPPEEDVGRYHVTTEVSWNRDATTGRATYKDIDVAVAWTEPTASEVRVTSSVYGHSNLVNTGDVVLTILEKASGKGIKNCHVTLTPPSGSDRTVRTDTAGEAFFGYVPTGGISLVAAPVGWVVDLNTIAGAVVTNDTLTRLTLLAEKASSVTVRVRNPSGDAISGATLTLTQTGTSRVYTATSDTAGHARFENLFSGDFTLNASITGSASATVYFHLNEGDDVTQQVTMADPSPMRVLVTDQNSVKVPGATVTVTNPLTGTVMTGTTADSGEAAFTISTDATYTVEASMAGYVSNTVYTYMTPAGGLVTLAVRPPSPGTITVYNSRTASFNFRPYRLTPAPAGWATTSSTAIARKTSYTFTNVTPGTYRIYVNPGTQPAGSYLSATITDGDAVTVTW